MLRDLRKAENLGVHLKWDMIIHPVVQSLSSRFLSVFCGSGDNGLQDDLLLPSNPNDSGPRMISCIAKIQKLMDNRKDFNWDIDEVGTAGLASQGPSVKMTQSEFNRM